MTKNTATDQTRRPTPEDAEDARDWMDRTENYIEGDLEAEAEHHRAYETFQALSTIDQTPEAIAEALRNVDAWRRANFR